LHELTVSDAQRCADYLQELALRQFLAKARPVTEAIREYMIQNYTGTETTRIEFEEAVRRLLDLRWDL
jgi:hypothetical protein